MEPSIFPNFLAKLAVRQRNENHLSDVTWAACESSDEFKILFLSFFFGNNPRFKRVELKREFTKGESRTDFYFKIDNQEYIIENKIYDRNNHFEAYKEDYNGAFFGWIANYHEQKREGIQIRDWAEFKNLLENKISENEFDIHTRLLIESYVKYLTSVCNIIKIEKMNLTNLSSLYFFNISIRKIIEQSSINNLRTKIYKEKINRYLNGYFYELQVGENPKKKIYPWFGVNYDGKGTGIFIGFLANDGWCKSVCEAKEILKGKEGKYFYFDDYYEGDDTLDAPALWCELKDEYFKEFNNEMEVEKQQNILTCFFNEVNLVISPYINEVPFF